MLFFVRQISHIVLQNHSSALSFSMKPLGIYVSNETANIHAIKHLILVSNQETISIYLLKVIRMWETPHV